MIFHSFRSLAASHCTGGGSSKFCLMNGRRTKTVYCGGLVFNTSCPGDEGLCCLDEIFSLDDRLDGAWPAIGVAFELCLDRGLSRTGNADEDGDILVRPYQSGIDEGLMMLMSRDLVVETRGDKLPHVTQECLRSPACSVSAPMMYHGSVFGCTIRGHGRARTKGKGMVGNFMISQACTIDTLATEKGLGRVASPS